MVGEIVDEVVDEVVGEVVGEVVDRSSNPISYITTTPGSYYNVIYLHSRRREPKSIFYTSLLPNSERQEIVLWLIGGASVAQGGQELLTATSV